MSGQHSAASTAAGSASRALTCTSKLSPSARAADGDQLGEHRVLAHDQEPVDAAGVVLGLGEQGGLVEGEQLPSRITHCPFTITSVTSLAWAA